MKHATSKILFAYWDGLRGERAAPERRDVRPGDIRHVLADCFILGFDDDRKPTFRLSGSRLDALFGRPLAGRELGNLWHPHDREPALDVVEMVAAETLGALFGLSGRNENGSEILLEMLLLPLRHRGRTNARILGALSSASIPPWAGLVPLASLEIRSRRMIEPLRSRTTESPLGPKRALFTVHQGGLA